MRTAHGTFTMHAKIAMITKKKMMLRVLRCFAVFVIGIVRTRSTQLGNPYVHST